MSVEILSSESISGYLEKHNYKIYKKFSDYRFKWGVYKVVNDTITFELQEKIHQFGFVDVCRWQGVLKENQLQILPIDRELQEGRLDFYTFSKNGLTFQFANQSLLDKATIDSKLSWVNY